jgi:hypothetical protein
MIIFKNFFSFALTFKAYDWIIDGGIRPTLIGISSIQIVVCLLSIPMCKFSRNRPKLVEILFLATAWCVMLTMRD